MAQQSRPPLVGVLEAASAAFWIQSYDAFREGLRELGCVEGRDIRIEFRYADGALDQLDALAVELVRLNPNVIALGIAIPGTLLARADEVIE